MFDQSPICEETQVFTFTGHVEDGFSESSSLVRGYALAPNAIAVIDAMSDAGFVVVAMSSLTDLREMQEILSAIQRRDPEAVSGGDLLLSEGMSNHVGPYTAEQVFTFAGRAGTAGPLSAGFMVAESADALIAHLRLYQFYVNAATSLSDIDAISQQLSEIALGQGDATACLDLLGLMEEAA